MRTLASQIRAALRVPPSPEDVASVTESTGVGVLITAINAVVYTFSVGFSANIAFQVPWLVSTLLLCVFMYLRSRRAMGHKITRVSRRTARKLVVFAAILALPWSILAFHVLAFSSGEHEVTVLMVCAGMVAGGTFMLHRVLAAALGFNWMILGALIAASLIQDGQVHGDHFWSTSVYAAVYGIFLTKVAFRTGQTARERDSSVTALSTAVARLERAQAQNYRLAHMDVVTGLPNRKSFHDRLAEMAVRYRETGQGFALLLLDLDRFKNVNDVFGHAIGDELLVQVAERLRGFFGDDDHVSRLGGDEFAVVLDTSAGAERVRAVAAELIAVLNVPADLAGRQIHPGTSIGAAICPAHSVEPSALMLDADLALHSAKKSGRGTCVVFDERLRSDIVFRDALEEGLRRAFDLDQTYVVYQPKLSLVTGDVIGAEALLRWRHPELGAIPPERFLAVASERGLLPTLSRTVANTVGSDILAWRRAGLAFGKVAINIHPDDLKSPELLMENIAALEARGVTNRDLMLEITEGCFIGRGTDAAELVLDGLADRGFELSLDDFGTGHASFSHLKKLPVSEIKIDRSFVAGITGNTDDRSIVAAIAEIARGMGIRSVAEGVERPEQRAILEEMGVEIGQGFLWAPPLEARAFSDFLRTGSLAGSVPEPGRAR